MESKAGLPPKQGLYDPRHEHDACGVGFVAHIKGRKSHDIVVKGLSILNNLRHRGATGADPLHGDGAGLLVQIPDAFFREEMAKQSVKLPKAGAYGVGMVFLPRNPAARAACVREIERAIAHHGQINTLQGNLNWIRSRQAPIHSKLLGADLDKIWPLIYDGQSDSASFDNALELLVMGGYPIAHAMMLMIPEAWAGNPLMDAKRRAFYEYHAALMEPWDGPAAVAFTDGKFIGATLDRNRLRPARYFITDDDLIVMSSEMGVLDIPQNK